MVAHTFNPRTQEADTRGPLCEFEASLVYIEFQYSHGYIVISSKKKS